MNTKAILSAVVGVLACTFSLSAWQFPLPEKFPSGVRVPSLDETWPNFVVRDGNDARLDSAPAVQAAFRCPARI